VNPVICNADSGFARAADLHKRQGKCAGRYRVERCVWHSIFSSVQEVRMHYDTVLRRGWKTSVVNFEKNSRSNAASGWLRRINASVRTKSLTKQRKCDVRITIGSVTTVSRSTSSLFDANVRKRILAPGNRLWSFLEEGSCEKHAAHSEHFYHEDGTILRWVFPQWGSREQPGADSCEPTKRNAHYAVHCSHSLHCHVRTPALGWANVALR